MKLSLKHMAHSTCSAHVAVIIVITAWFWFWFWFWLPSAGPVSSVTCLGLLCSTKPDYLYHYH